MGKKIFYIIAFICLFSNISFGQWDSLSRTKIDTFLVKNAPYFISKNLILASSGELSTEVGEKLGFRIEENQLFVSDQVDSISSADSLFFSYRFYEDNLPDSLGRSYKTGLESRVVYIAIDIPKNSENEALIPQGLNYSGSFGRGLTAGNSQSLVLNSTFNMQLGGKIGDGIDLRAVISDANIPIQAEGTTQQLQEFDQVFIELSKEKQSLIAGDYRLERPEGYFVNYSKKLKGLRYTNESIYQKTGNLAVSGSFAISGGKFSRNNLVTTEANQGPYKLQGAENEQFIIVQSGSEKIYLDGELLTRGENNDYVIFYDRAEITFTEKRPITKDSRIIIDFEYLVQNYARSISTANADWTLDKHAVSLRLYDESDNKNSSGIFELTTDDKKFLSLAGDNPENNLQQGIFINEDFDPNGVFYERIIGQSGEVYLEYSVDPTVAQYQAIFTDVGDSQGSYNIDDENNLNGRVYKYVGPNQGRYLPVRKLIPPERKQMISLADAFKYHKNGQLNAEISMSNFDQNLFSDIDQSDNVSYAIRTDWNHQLTFGPKVRPEVNTEEKDSLNLAKKAQENHSIGLTAYGEYLAADFQFLNPFRNAEFNRDWNVVDILDRSDEILAGAGVEWSQNCPSCRNSRQNLQYNVNTYQLSEFYSGIRHNLAGTLSSKSIAMDLKGSYLESSSSVFNSTFLRPNGRLDKQWNKLASIHTGVSYDGEYNNKIDAMTDTLLTGSNEYDAYKVYIESDESRPLKTTVFYTKRFDRIASNNQQRTFSVADNYGTNLQWTGKRQSINMNLTYRLLETDENLNQAVKDAETFLGGIDYQYSLWDGFVRGVTNFNFNSGQEPKREFDYREVAPGEGNFIWIDNGDGIEDKNEFQPAPFSDQGNYIQVNLFNNEFIQVYKQDYVQTLRIEPTKWKLSDKKWKKGLSKLSTQTSLRLTRKDLQQNGLPDFQFYVLDEIDPSLVSFVSSINQNVFWNRGNPAYDIIFNYLDNTTSVLLTTGNEIRSSENYSLKYRQNIKKTAEIELIGTQRQRGLRNVNFPANNYLIEGWIGELKGSYRYKQQVEFRVDTKYETKGNTLGIETANSISGTMGFSYTNTQKMRIDGNFNLNRINYFSDDNPTIELIMLEGLKNGNNFLWELRFTKRLINNFDLSINYNGRKTGESKVVHVANAQIKATF